MKRSPFEIVLSKGAEADFESIHAYLAINRSPQAAAELLDGLISKYASLASFPLRGSIPTELADIGTDEFRQILLGPYRIVYFVGIGKVVIALVADGRRDMRTLLQSRLLNPRG